MTRFLIPLALVAFLATPAIAQDALTGGQPIQVTADSLSIEESKKEATFTGNVVVTRPNLTVTAATVVVVYGSGIDDVQNFDASGNVRIETPGQVATGDRAVFDPKTQMLRLTGNVMVQNSAGTIGGAVLTVDLETNNTVFEAGEGQRVTGVFTPQ
jgi:lipopolysaccharide export system protein LptA